MKSKGSCEANKERSEIPRVKDQKIYLGKTLNGECIWVQMRIPQWNPENDNALYYYVSHFHMHII